MKCSLVLTTIYDPVVLDEYFANIRHHGHVDDVTVYLVVDRKTPNSAQDRIRSLISEGFKIEAPDFEQQEKFLRSVGFAPQLVPYNSDNRRNIGYLMAYESNCDFVISIDDDNFPGPLENDIFEEHSIVCRGNKNANVVYSNTRFYNICDLLEFSNNGPVYARGFPYDRRHKDGELKYKSEVVDVHINAGLWTRHPDIDGISWLVNPANAIRMVGNSIVLGRDTWSPINTQNTGLRRDSLGAYYFLRMGYPMGGVSIDRYGDIFSGYFVQACAKHLKGDIRFGTPVADHRRNSHNYMNDAANEWACIQLLEDLLPWMTEALHLDGSSYLEAFECLSYAIEEQVQRFSGKVWTDAAKGYFHFIAYHMRAWVNACRAIDGYR